jgi:lipopolysaccharide transport system permease protein
MRPATLGAIDPARRQSASLAALPASLWRARHLVVQLARREVLGRYRGSVLGIAWSFFQPLLMLAVYTFVFASVLQLRWGVHGDAPESRAEFAIVLFVGIIVHGLFAEVLTRAPLLIVGNANFVKKVVFPLEVLAPVSLVAALFHALVSLCVLLLAYLVVHGTVCWTAVFLPLVLAPLVVLTLGCAWVLAALGAYVRDVGQVIGMLMTVLMFLSPVFYPVTALPASVRPLILANPLTLIIGQARDVLIWGRLPDWTALAVYALVAFAVAWAGFAFFQKTRKGFADVL